MKTQVNGVEITPQMAKVFDRWYDSKIPGNELVSYYWQKLGEIQDYFCRQLDEFEADKDTLIDMIMLLISIKDDFRMLIPKIDNNEQ